MTTWHYSEVGENRIAAQEVNALNSEDPFLCLSQRLCLIEKILQLSSNPGDIVLDSLAGSGSKGAIAHKMGRR